ncbi:paraquat-inducible protein A [Spongiibacter taiwanensis]|uniref:paraquat-inducible protein A n=1 Tax=Spongiibacter taiwanensis TaxID=1748242 RepID=UPI0020353E0F|nr:paraquat-inducible protein A [Spongiibacter taiwanensis]USA44116.1 paraquat-inducible protein A [Spongiibacter taiwanensis]
MTEADSLCACPDCDLLVTLPSSGKADHHTCPRCDAVLSPAQRGPDNLALAAAVSGLILFAPAITLPLMKVDMLGQHGSHSLVSGVGRLLAEQETPVALLVLLCTIAAPFLQLLFTALTCICIRQGWHPSRFPQLVRATHKMQEWSMLEVFAMGALVAYIKMMDPGEISLATGAPCLTGLLLCVILAGQHFHSELAWQHWSERPQ